MTPSHDDTTAAAETEGTDVGAAAAVETSPSVSALPERRPPPRARLAPTPSATHTPATCYFTGSQSITCLGG